MTKNTYTWNDGKKFLAEHDVVLISAGLDEVPMGYKDIESVMAAQAGPGRRSSRDSIRSWSKWRPKANGRKTKTVATREPGTAAGERTPDFPPSQTCPVARTYPVSCIL